MFLLICIISISGCSKEEQEDNSFYQGFIMSVYPDNDIFYIKITHSPFNTYNMPRKNDEINVKLSDFPNIILKINQEIVFSVISAKSGLQIPEDDYLNWNAKINILKLK